MEEVIVVMPLTMLVLFQTYVYHDNSKGVLINFLGSYSCLFFVMGIDFSIKIIYFKPRLELVIQRGKKLLKTTKT